MFEVQTDIDVLRLNFILPVVKFIVPAIFVTIELHDYMFRNPQCMKFIMTAHYFTFELRDPVWTSWCCGIGWFWTSRVRYELQGGCVKFTFKPFQGLNFIVINMKFIVKTVNFIHDFMNFKNEKECVMNFKRGLWTSELLVFRIRWTSKENSCRALKFMVSLWTSCFWLWTSCFGYELHVFGCELHVVYVKFT